MYLDLLTISHILYTATGWGQPSWGPNLEEFRKRFDPDKTYGEGPNRLKNMYFTYLVEMRALAKAAPYLEQVCSPNDVIKLGMVWSIITFCLMSKALLIFVL